VTDSALKDLLGCRGKFSTLEYLEIGIEALAGRPYNAFEIAPRLNRLRLTEGALGREFLGKWKFPWAQLTKFEIRLRVGHGGDELRETLLQLQNVEELRVETPVREYFAIDKNAPVFQLARLRRLDVSVDLAGIVDWFDTPLLEHLEINDYFDFANNLEIAKEAISSLIHRSSCRIHRLTLDHCGIKVIRMVLGVRALTASVEELFINRGESEILVIRDIPGFDERIYLPNLHVLRLKCCPLHATDEFVAAISYLLEARGEESELVASHDIAPLRRIAIQFDSCSTWWCDHDIISSTTLPRNPLGKVLNWPSYVEVTIVESSERNLGFAG